MPLDEKTQFGRCSAVQSKLDSPAHLQSGATGSEEYSYAHGDETGVDRRILDAARTLLERDVRAGARVLDLGCGNGYFSGQLAKAGFDVVGVEASVSGVEQARKHWPGIRFEHLDGAEQDAMRALGPFDAVISIEVIEHVHSTAAFVASIRAILAPNGVAIVSTPYHGYLKNVMIALAGRHDRHFDPLWEGGHIKFFSIRTLGRAFAAQGMTLVEARRVGRIPPLAKSIVASFRARASD